MGCNIGMAVTKGFLCFVFSVAVIGIVVGVSLRFILSDQSDRLSPEVQQICDDYFAWRMRDMPEFATFVGFHDYNDYLDNLSMAAYDNRLSTIEDFLQQVSDLEPTLEEHADVTNMIVLRDELETYRDGFPFKNFYMALSNKEGVQVDFLRLLSWMPHDNLTNYNSILSRLDKLPDQINQIIDLFTAGVKEKILLHERSMDKVLGQIDTFIVSDPETSLIYKENFVTFPEEFSKEDIATLQEKAKNVIRIRVVPAYQKLRDYIETSYDTRIDIAVTSLPNGHKLYAQIVKFHTGSEESPKDIQQLGYAEVARIEALMLEIVEELGYNDMPVPAFSDMISKDTNNYCSSEEELLDAFRNAVYNVTTPAVPEIFKNIPTADILVAADPSSTGAFYLTGSYDGSRPGVFYVGTEDIKSQPKYNIITLSLHEGNPGHHLQGSHSLESPTIPYFRSTMDDRNYCHAPSRFPIRAYYAEGWGLYSETTGFDMALFEDPLDRYGHYAAELFRASRLVVDTGIHALGWTRQDAIDYMSIHTAMTELDIENEVDRYITWPGQALSYKSGQLQFTAFRNEAEKELGDKFDIKDFHDIVLESVGPMTLVNNEVNEWVQSILLHE